MPDAMNVLDGVADLFAELFLIKLHLQKETDTTGRIKRARHHRFIAEAFIQTFLYFLERFPNTMADNNLD